MDLIQPSSWQWVLVFGLALTWDLLWGEMPAACHPVVWMGRLITWGEAWIFRPQQKSWQQQGAGALLVLACCGLSYLVYQLCLSLLSDYLWAETLFMVFILKGCFALRELGRAAWQVQEALEAKDLARARFCLRSLCSREASQLQQEELVGASVSSVGENLSDSFVAPLFFYLIAGVPGALLFRMVNTLDARIGYHGHYEYFGKVAARLDDLLGFVPARLTAFFLLLAGALRFRPAWRSWQILRRDSGKTPSPNGGWPMAAMAGVLGVRLEKPATYRLGDPDRHLVPATISQAWHLAIVTGLLFAIAMLVLQLVWRTGGF